MFTEMLCPEGRRRRGRTVAVCFPGMDVPGLWESQWTLMLGPEGRHTGYMVNRLDYWIDGERWRRWLMDRRARSARLHEREEDGWD